MGRPPKGENKQRQVAVALPPETRSRLEAAAAAAGRSVAEEIRRRINLTILAEEHDPETRELAADIQQLAEWVNREKGFNWHSHDKARETFIAIVKLWLDGLKPPASLKTHREKPRVGVSALMWGDDDPATLARSIVRNYRRFKDEIKKSTEEMQNLLKRESSHDK